MEVTDKLTDCLGLLHKKKMVINWMFAFNVFLGMTSIELSNNNIQWKLALTFNFQYTSYSQFVNGGFLNKIFLKTARNSSLRFFSWICLECSSASGKT